ncbi:MAG TPA: AMP-binding protein [Acidimicrobiales bacterium]|nr:AMP-binding protein [Acidimicrobiales bacterium]
MNLARIIDGHPDDAVALISRGKPTTYGALRDQVAAMRGGLAGLGLEPGDRVALLCANNRWFVVSYLAALGLGCVVVPLNPLSPAIEIRNQLATVGARAVVVGPAGRASFDAVDRAEIPTVEVVVAPGGVEVDGAAALEDLLGSDPVPTLERDRSDLAVLVFTAGTAGSPKAAMLTHGNLASNLEQVQLLPERGLTPDDVSLGVLPLFHIFGLNVVLGLTLVAGASVVLVERFDPATAAETITGNGCTVVAGAPPMWVVWSSMPGLDPDTFASVRLALSGASKLAEETAEVMQRRFGLQILEGYGLTEASPIVTSSAGGAPVRAGSIGTPIPGVELRLVDDGQDALLGDAGEIWVRGPNVFAGYWKDDEATASVLTSDGWLRTGDMAVADHEGNLSIVDRAKDLIIVSGFNVYPAEVEAALLEHPGVDGVAVVGIESPYSGETVKAYVVAAPGVHLDEDEVIEHCAHRLSRYKCPTKVMFVDEIPQGLGGKVLRRELR